MPGVIPSEELAVLLIRDEHWMGNIADVYIEEGTENGRIKFASQKWPHIQIYWTGGEWSIRGVFFQGGHTLGSDEYPKTSTGDRLHVKIIQAGHTMNYDSGSPAAVEPHVPVPHIPPMAPKPPVEPFPKKPKPSDAHTISHDETVVDSGKVEFLYNLPTDTGTVPPLVAGGAGFKWQNLGRLYWNSSGAMYGSMGTNKQGFDFEGHVNNRSTQSHPADRQFQLFRTKAGKDKPDVMEGILPTKQELDKHFGKNCDLSHPSEFKMSVTMPPDFPDHVSITCIVFKAEVHEDILIEQRKASDMDNANNAFDR